LQAEANRTTVRRLYEAYVRGDVDRVAAMIDDDIDWVVYGPIHIFPFEGARRGKRAVLDVLAAISTEYELRRYDPLVIVADAERAAAMSDTSFVQRSTGRMLRFRIANFFRFSEGRIVEFREFSDTFDVAQQALGKEIDV